MEVDLYFTDYFEVDPDALEEHGAFDISVVSDLPLFIDPFLLFNSQDSTYQQLHQQILDYLLFLRDRAAEQESSAAAAIPRTTTSSSRAATFTSSLCVAAPRARSRRHAARLVQAS
jgi:hypothetical protein